MATAYRMSAEIADWLNAHARAHGIDAVELIGIRPTGVAVVETDRTARSVRALGDEQAGRHENTAIIAAGDTWSHKGVEYDGVVVDTDGMSPAEVYLAASRAAHELIVVN